MKTVTVVRSKWARRTEGLDKMGSSYLLNDRGNMCCLGFACKCLADASEQYLFSKCSPAGFLNSLIYERKEIPEVLKVFVDDKPQDPTFIDELDRVLYSGRGRIYYSNDFSEQAIGINDNWHTTDAEKEAALKKLFAENGLNIEFVD